MDLQSFLFNSLNGNGLDGESFTSSVISMPPYCTMTENDDTICIFIDIPGVDIKTVDLNFYNNKIEVKGEKVIPYNIDDKIIRHEIKYGEFKKILNIPISITSRESVKTSYEHGVLTIMIFKKIEEKNMFNIKL